jgi:hypothetical protein
MIDPLDNPLFDEAPNSDIPTATREIYGFIGEYLARPPDTHINRASSATLCYKRRWYQGQGYKPMPLTPRKMVNFLLGNLSEMVMQFFIKEACVGPGKLYSEVDFGKEIGSFNVQGKKITVYEQEDLYCETPDFKITSHVDGFGKRNSDGAWELIECKSSADYGFDKFKEEGVGDYIKQAHVNMRTTKAIELGITQVRFFYLKKNTGHLWDRLFDYNPQTFLNTVYEYLIANNKTEPRAPYNPIAETFRGKPTGRMVLPWQCAYCSYVNVCKPEFELQFKGEKPIYVLKENRQ